MSVQEQSRIGWPEITPVRICTKRQFERLYTYRAMIASEEFSYHFGKGCSQLLIKVTVEGS
jgi:hypothetical protein